MYPPDFTPEYWLAYAQDYKILMGEDDGSNTHISEVCYEELSHEKDKNELRNIGETGEYTGEPLSGY